MSISQAFYSWLRRGRWSRRSTAVAVAEKPIEAEDLVRAFGDCLSLLATILEREGVITASKLAEMLGDFATVTGDDRPKEGKILMFWVAYLEDTAAALLETPCLKS